MTKFEQLPADMQTAFVTFASANGRYWKQALRDDWISTRPKVEGALRHYRNAYGPSELCRLKVPAAK